jgi:hypothetical protein
MGEDKICSYDSVRKSTKDVNIFKLDKILIPINENQLQWIVVKVSMLQKSTECCDPMVLHQNLQVCLNDISLFIKEEHLKRNREVLPDVFRAGDSSPCKTRSSQRNPMASTVVSLSWHLSVLQLSTSPFVVA